LLADKIDRVSGAVFNNSDILLTPGSNCPLSEQN
jgi:hypothetical protein